MIFSAQPGQLYNAEDGRKALRDVFALGLFDNVQIFPRPNPKDEAKVRETHDAELSIQIAEEAETQAINPSCIARPEPKFGMVQVDVDIMVKERPMKSADLEAEWQIAPGNNGKPTIASIVPGGSLTFEHRNIARRGRQVSRFPKFV